MWISILINIIISILIIVLGHYLWNYLKETYSEKNVRDVLGSQTKKYKNIIEQLQKKNQDSFEDEDHPNLPEESFVSESLVIDLKDDLEQFLQNTVTSHL